MSPVDPRMLRSYARTPRTGGACWHCRYDTTGLIGDICPECGVDLNAEAEGTGPASLRGWERSGGGTPGKRPPRRFASKLGEAPISWLRTFHWACLLTVACPILAIAATGVWIRGFLAASAALFLLTSFVWFTAAYFITRARPRMAGIEVDVRTEWAGLRWSTRWLQTSWVIVASLHLADVLSFTGIGPAWHVVAYVFAYLGMAGLIPMLLYIANLMDWADDTEFAYRIRGCALFISIGLLMAAAIPLMNLLSGMIARTLWAVLVYFFVALYFILLVMPMAYVLYSMVQITRIASWAVTNHGTQKAVDERLLQKALADQQQGEYERWRAEQQSIEAERQARHQARHHTGNKPAKTAPQQQSIIPPTNRIQPGNNDGIYDIEPDNNHPRS